MRHTDVLCGACLCGRDFEVPVSTSPDQEYRCPHCNRLLAIAWPKTRTDPEPEPEPKTISDQEHLP